MSKIIRYCKTKEEHSGDNSFDICRPYIFGNPYTHIKDRDTLASIKVKTRDEAIKAYDAYFDAMLKDETEAGDRFREEWDKMVKRAMEADFSWESSALQYQELYDWLIG